MTEAVWAWAVPTDMPNPGRDLRQSVVPAQVHQTDQDTVVRREFAAAVTLAGDDEHGDPFDQGVRQVERGRIRNQRGSCTNAVELRLSSAGQPAFCHRFWCIGQEGVGPSAGSDLTAARNHRITRICERQGVPVLANRAYMGAGARG